MQHLSTDAGCDFCQVWKTGQQQSRCRIIRLSLESRLKQKRKTQVWSGGSKIDLISQAPVARQEDRRKKNAPLSIYAQTCLSTHTLGSLQHPRKPPLSKYTSCVLVENRLLGHQRAKQAKAEKKNPPPPPPPSPPLSFAPPAAREGQLCALLRPGRLIYTLQVSGMFMCMHA